MAYTTLDIKTDGPVSWCTLNRPDALNSLSRQLVEDLHGFYDELARQTETRVVVLRGAGRAFCAGLDLKEGGGELIFSFGRGPFLNRGFVPGSLQARRIVNLNAEYHLLLGRPERGYGLTPIFFRSWELAFVGDLSTLDYGIGAPPAELPPGGWHGVLAAH